VARRPTNGDGIDAITDEQVRALAVELLVQQLPLGLDGYRYADADVHQVLVAAAAQARSVESVARQLAAAPSANRVRQVLAEQLFAQTDPEALEDECNRLLVARLPAGLDRRTQRLAVDLVLLPYYGAPAAEAGELRRGEAKAGTTRFHCYATAYLIRDGRRVTLALAFVHAEDALLDVLAELLQRVAALGVPVERLYLDRGFASVAVLAWLQHQPFVSVVALPKRGQRLQALLTGRAGYRTTYAMASAEDGPVTFPLWVAVAYAAGRRGQHGREYLAFAVLGRTPCTLPVARLAKEYRRRFGVESSYRLAHQVRPRTTSRDPALRLLLVALACLLVNLWVYVKAALVAATAPGLRAAARRWLDAHFRLDTFADLLLEAVKARWGTHTALRYPFRLTAPTRIAEY
jgi:putative transposase